MKFLHNYLLGKETMNPYETPKSDLDGQIKKAPRKVFIVYLLIVLSFVVFLIEEILFAVFVMEDILGVENYIFIPIWAGLLYWVTSAIRKRKKNPKNNFLILSIIVAGMSLFGQQTPYSVYTGMAEAVCFLGVYYALRQDEFIGWFGEIA